jgi:UDP-N-acetylmuramate: L-alanyl-gamma-D-glutamyl-meso-diaminopimelate ligase
MPPLQPEDIKQAFGNENIQVFNDSQQLTAYLHSLDWNNQNLLLMSSGTYDNMDIPALTTRIGQN